MGPNWVLSDSDWGGPTLKNRSGVPIGAILSALAPRQVTETHAPCSHSEKKNGSLTDQKNALWAPDRKILPESICPTFELLDFMTVRIRFGSN